MGKFREDNSLIRYVWQKYNGEICCILIPNRIYELPIEEQIIRISKMQLFFPANEDKLLEGIVGIGSTDGRLLADKSSFYRNYKGQRVVHAKIANFNQTYFKSCPKNLFESAYSLMQGAGYTLSVSLEFEFQLLDSKTLQPISDHGSYSMLSTNKVQDSLAYLYENLTDHQGEENVISLQKIPGSGHYSIIFNFQDAKKAIETIFKVIDQFSKQKNDMMINYNPLCSGGTSNGIILNLSLQQNNQPVLSDPNRMFGISQIGESFMAGIYHGLNPLTHLLAPSHQSLSRLVPGQRAGVFKYWSIDHKEAPMSLVEPVRFLDTISAFQLRMMDSSANFYLAFASLITLGMNGIQNSLTLPQPFNDDPSNLSEGERQNLQIFPLPQTLEQREAAVLSDQNKPIIDFAGEELMKNYNIARRADHLFFEKKTKEEALLHIWGSNISGQIGYPQGDEKGGKFIIGSMSF